MDNEGLTTEEQLALIGERVGQPLDVDIYVGEQPIATRGHLITDALVKKLADIEPRQLRFSRERITVPAPDQQLQELLEKKIKPDAAALALEAGVTEDLTEEARQIATRKVREIFESCRYLTKLDLASVSELATTLINRVSSLESSAFKLHDLRQYDEYTYYHSVNVCVLGITLFRDYISNEQELNDFGVGLLLHDIGKSKIDLKILNKPAGLTDEEFLVMKRHVVYGHNLVKGNGDMAPLSKDLILNHHERVNGTGYTRGLTEGQQSFFDMVSAVCDVFDAVTTDRAYCPKMDVHRAVSILIRGSGIQFNTRIVNHFLRGIGRFPVGTFVLLSNGEIGVVSRVNSNALSLPVIRVVFDAEGERLAQPRTVDLYEQRELYVDRPLDISYSPARHKLEDTNPAA